MRQTGFPLGESGMGGMVPQMTISNARSTIREQLSRRKLDLEDQLGRVNDAIEAFDRNPGVSEVFEAVNKAFLG